MRPAFLLTKQLLAVTVCGIGFWSVAGAQNTPATLLEIDLENAVVYSDDGVAASELADTPSMNRRFVRPFMRWAFIADVVAVNGIQSKGTAFFQGTQGALNPAPRPRSAIADISRSDLAHMAIEILQADGTPVGTIMGLGLTGGPPAPGSPPAAINNNFAIIGGTGAFFGARGQYSIVNVSAAQRQASMAEDPANRRSNGGGKLRALAHLISGVHPEVVVTQDGPAVVHSNDFSRITLAKPARPGEILSLYATGLGPTRPAVEPGRPFPSGPVHEVNSPVQVTVNGKAAEVLAAVGYPGAVDGYQVNFRVPADTVKGPAAVRLSTAWIAAPQMVIPVE